MDNHNSPHRFNDAWEYDLASNTWVLLYTPDYNDRGPITDYDRQTLVLKDGWLRTKKGGPARVEKYRLDSAIFPQNRITNRITEGKK